MSAQGGVCLPSVGCVCPGGVYLGAVCLRGVSVQGVSAQGVYTPPVDRMTDAPENITFPQLLLRTIKIQNETKFQGYIIYFCLSYKTQNSTVQK